MNKKFVIGRVVRVVGVSDMSCHQVGSLGIVVAIHQYSKYKPLVIVKFSDGDSDSYAEEQLEVV